MNRIARLALCLLSALSLPALAQYPGAPGTPTPRPYDIGRPPILHNAPPGVINGSPRPDIRFNQPNRSLPLIERQQWRNQQAWEQQRRQQFQRYPHHRHGWDGRPSQQYRPGYGYQRFGPGQPRSYYSAPRRGGVYIYRAP